MQTQRDEELKIVADTESEIVAQKEKLCIWDIKGCYREL